MSDEGPATHASVVHTNISMRMRVCVCLCVRILKALVAAWQVEFQHKYFAATLRHISALECVELFGEFLFLFFMQHILLCGILIFMCEYFRIPYF